jgi:hypothetical protein
MPTRWLRGRVVVPGGDVATPLPQAGQGVPYDDPAGKVVRLDEIERQRVRPDAVVGVVDPRTPAVPVTVERRVVPSRGQAGIARDRLAEPVVGLTDGRRARLHSMFEPTPRPEPPKAAARIGEVAATPSAKALTTGSSRPVVSRNSSTLRASR